MNDIVNKGSNEFGEKFFLFSGHDTNVANIWRYFRPVNFVQDDLSGKGRHAQWFSVPFSSYIQIELHRNKTCVEEQGHHEECFLMRFMANGQALQLQGLKADERTGFSNFAVAK